MQGATCLEMQLIDVTKGIFETLVLFLELVLARLRLIVCHLVSVGDVWSPMERGGGKGWGHGFLARAATGCEGHRLGCTIFGGVDAKRRLWLTGPSLVATSLPAQRANNLDLQVHAVSKLRFDKHQTTGAGRAQTAPS